MASLWAMGTTTFAVEKKLNEIKSLQNEMI